MTVPKTRTAIGRFGDARALAVWAVLVIATAASYLLSAEHTLDSATQVAAVVISVAVVKMRLVAIHFMELAHAPLPLRLVVEAYCLILPVVLIGLYLAG